MLIGATEHADHWQWQHTCNALSNTTHRWTMPFAGRHNTYRLIKLTPQGAVS